MGDSTYPGPLRGQNSLILRHADRRLQQQRLAATLLERIFHRLPRAIAVRLWCGPTFRVGGAGLEACNRDPEAAFVLVFRSPEAVCRLVLGRDPLRLADAYFRGEVDIEGDLFAALVLKEHLESLRLSWRERMQAVFTALKLRSLNGGDAARDGAVVHAGGAAPPAAPDRALRLERTVRGNTRADNRDAIEFHYDVSNEFYKLWLDRAMVYSCGYFERPDASLDEAQQAKLEHICRKLLLQPGQRFLDIGCGWGALVIHAAQHHGVRAHGITLSPKQLEIARERVLQAGLADRVTLELRDYRDLDGAAVYDRIASVGMFEHVGLKNLPAYFNTVLRVLKPDGLFLNHGITHEQAGWDKNVSTEFINRYVFPDAQLDSIANIQKFMEDARFEIADVEGLRRHYALTLRAWAERLERHHERALEFVSETTYRVWRLYMTACALEFESGHLGIYQVLASKRGAGHAQLPLTRRYLYQAGSADAAMTAPLDAR